MELAMLTAEMQDEKQIEKIIMTYHEYVEFFQKLNDLHFFDVYSITNGDYYLTHIINCKYITKEAAKVANLQTQQKTQQKSIINTLVKHYKYSSVIVKDGGDYLC